MSGEALVALGGIIGGILTAVFAWLTGRDRGKVDESATVLNEWQKLIKAHQDQIGHMVAEIADLRNRLAKAEATIVKLQDENRALRDQLLQHSKSTAMLIGDIHPTSNFRTGDDEGSGK